MNQATIKKIRTEPAATAQGRCLCGKVRLEIDVPARWAWHDHSKPSRQAHGAAYATYVGGWKSRFRIAIEQTPEWAYTVEPLGPLKGFPGIVWQRPRRQRRTRKHALTAPNAP